MKPTGWPNYMIEKRLKSGAVAYYWNPPVGDLKAGFTLDREALGQDLAAATERANELNKHLYAFRGGRNAAKDLDLQPRFARVDWLIERYYRSRTFAKLSTAQSITATHSISLPTSPSRMARVSVL